MRRSLALGAVLAAALAPAARAQTPPPTYVFVGSGNQVEVLDPVTLRLLQAVQNPPPPAGAGGPASIPVPTRMVSSIDGKTIFTMNGLTSSITPIDVQSLTVLPPISLNGFTPFDIAVSPDGYYLYVACTFRLFVIDAAKAAAGLGNAPGVIVQNNNLPGVFDGAANTFNVDNEAVGVSPDLRTLYVAAQNADVVTGRDYFVVYAFSGSSYPASGNSSLRSTFGATTPRIGYVKFTSDSSRAFLANEFAAMVVNSPADTVSGTVNLPAIHGSGQFEARADQNAFYTSDRGLAQVYQFDASLSLTRTIPMTLPGELNSDYSTDRIASNVDSTKLYVSMTVGTAGGGLLRRYDSRTNTVLSGPTFPSGGNAVTLSFPHLPVNAPTFVSGASPPDGAQDVPVNATVSVAFSAWMDQATLPGAFSLVQRSNGAPVAGSVATTGTGLVFTPAVSLATNGAAYLAVVSSAAKDIAGNPVTPKTFSFSTSQPPAITNAQAEAAGTPPFQSATLPVPSLQADAAATAQDTGSGLASATAKVELSVDGGASYAPVPGPRVSITGPDGTTAAQTLKALGLTLVQSYGPSQPNNVVRFSISDKAGNLGSLAAPLSANINPVTPPLAASPGDGLVTSQSPVSLAWTLDPRLPVQALQSFEVQVASVPDFASGVQTLPVAAPALSVSYAPPAAGRYYWRVRAKDNFSTAAAASLSPYSAVRSFLYDNAAPQLSAAQAAVAGSGGYQDVANPIPSLSVDVRAQALDALSGLSASSAKVELSVDGGTYGAAASISLTGTDGATTPQTLSAAGLTLVQSYGPTQARNSVRFSISDKAGNLASLPVPVLVNVNPTVAPVLASPVGGVKTPQTLVHLAWTLDPAVPIQAIQSFVIQVAADPLFTQPQTFTQSAPSTSYDAVLSPGTHYWRVRAKDNFSNAAADSLSPYSAAASFVVPGPPAVRITSPPGAAVTDPGVKLQAVYTKTDSDLNMGSLTLSLDGAPVTPVVDVDYSGGTDNGAVQSAASPPPLVPADLPVGAAKGGFVAAGGYLCLLGGSQGADAFSPRILSSLVSPTDGSLAAWAPAGSLPQGLQRPGVAAVKGVVYLVGGFNAFYFPNPDGTRGHVKYSTYFQRPVNGAFGSWTQGPALLTPVQGAAVISASRRGDFLYAIGGDGDDQSYADAIADVQFAQLAQDGTPGAWKRTTPLPVPLTGAAAFEWHGRVFVAGGQTLTGTFGHTLFTPSNGVYFADMDGSGNLSPWTKSAAVLPALNTANPLATTSPNDLGITQSAPLVFQNGQLLFFNGTSVLWTTLDPNTGDLRPAWNQSPNALAASLQFAAAAVSNGRAYVAGGWNGSSLQSAVYATAVNSGSPIDATATYYPTPPLSSTSHALSASIQDVNSLSGTASSAFSVSPQNVPLSASLGTFSSYVPGLTFTALDPATQPTPVDVALQAGLVIPSGLFIYQVSPHAVFDSPASITLSWSDPGIVGGALHMFKYNGQAWVPVTETGRTANSITGQLFSASSFALLAPERTPPAITSFTPVNGSTVAAASAPFFSAAFSDDSRVDPRSVRLSLDSVDMTSAAAVTPAAAVYTPAVPLADGRHVLTLSLADIAGNYAQASATFTVDGTPPAAVTSLQAVALDTGSIRLTWTSPGDNGLAGDIADAAVSVSLSAGSQPAAFSTATAQVVIASGPLPAGSPLSWVAAGLLPGTTYYAAVFTRDAVGNWSPPSNTASARTAQLPPGVYAVPVPFAAVGTGGLTVGWFSPLPPGTLYSVDLATVAAFSSLVGSSQTYGQQAGFAGLLANTRYFARVSTAPGAFTVVGDTYTLMEPPTQLLFDEVSSGAVVAAVYAPTPAFSNLDSGLSGTDIAIGGLFRPWHRGNTWAALAPMPTARRLVAAAALMGRVYALGGFDGNNFTAANEEYDPGGDTWRTVAPLPVAEAIPEAAAAVASKHSIYALGTLFRPGGGLIARNDIYDPTVDRWSSGAVPTPRRLLGAIALNDVVYALGGENADFNEAYDVNADTWSTKARMPLSWSEFGVATMRGRVYALAGAAQEYDPVTNAWMIKASAPYQANDLGTGGIGGKVYMAGGCGPAQVLDPRQLLFEFDPLANSWVRRADLSTPRCQEGAAATGGKLYVVGGTFDGTPFANNEVYDPGVAEAFAGLTPNTLYTFTAKARNSLGVETVSVTASTYTWAAPPGLIGATFQSVFPSSVSLQWGANGNPTGTQYLVQGSTSSTFDASAASAATTWMTSLSTTLSLQVGGTWYFRAQARNAVQVPTPFTVLGSTLPIMLVTNAIFPPGSVSPPFAGVGVDSLTVLWSTAANPAGTLYEADIATDPAFGAVIASSRTFNNQASFAGLPANAHYFTRAAAYEAVHTTWTAFTVLGDTYTFVEPPTQLVFDDVSSTTILAAAYAPTPAFSNLDSGLSGTDIAIGGLFRPWHRGNTWAALAPMPTARRLVAAAAVQGRLYALGGFAGSLQLGNFTAANEEYDPGGDTWRTVAPLPVAESIQEAAAAVASKHSIYALGVLFAPGGGLIARNDIYDPTVDRWSSGAVPTPRRLQSAIALNDVVYALGGAGAGSGGNGGNINEAYDVNADTWSTKAPMLIPGGEFGVAVMRGRVYTLAGATQEYDPVTNAWMMKAPAPYQANELGTGGIGGKVYMAGGCGPAQVLDPRQLLYEFDPLVNSWVRRADMPTPRCQEGAAASGGKLYVVGGTFNGTPFANNEVYDPGVAESFAGLAPNTLYTFTAKARNSLGVETVSVTASTYTWAAVPAPSNLAGVQSNSLQAHWTGGGNPPGTLYRVQLATTPDFAVLAASAATTASQATLNGLTPATTYYARVQAVNGAGVPTAFVPLGSTRTYFGAVSPDGVATLMAPVPVSVAVVSTAAAAPAYTVAIASQGLTPAGTAFYELTSGLVFSSAAPAIISFTFDPLAVDAASLAIYSFNGSSWTSTSIFNQTVTIAGNIGTITGAILHTSLYAPMVRDTLPPVTTFSVAGSSAVLEGRLFCAEGSSGALTARDAAPRGAAPSGAARTFYSLYGGPVTVYSRPFGLSEGHRVVGFLSVDNAGNAEQLRTADFYLDATPPLLAVTADQSTFAFAGGFGTASSSITLTIAARDPDVGGASSGLAGFAFTLDGSSGAPSFTVGSPTATASVFLRAGAHAVSLTASDRLGHQTVESLFVAVGDTVPPVTGIVIGTPQARLADGSILVSAQTGMTLAATDYAQAGVPPSGVASTYYRVTPADRTPGAFSTYVSSFVAPAPDGTKLAEFYSVDRARNVETTKSTTVVLDATPPALAFAFPRPDEGGLCRLVQGALSVRGSAQDLHLSSWSLAAGGVLVGSGSANASGTLGLFDATGLSGPVALDLAAQDSVQNASSASLRLQGGQPLRDLLLGGRELLDKPRGVATAPDRVYVSDTNHDVVRVFDSAGNPLATFGDARGALRLNKPAGLAVDVSGNVFVADANNKRVLKLSSAGSLLVEYGKGLLHRPVAVALFGGNVVAADAEAGELVVFSPAGALAARVPLPRPEKADDRRDEEEARPAALAADAAGDLWVADAKGGRVLRYDAAFALRQTIGGFQRPSGVAVSPSGACLAVSDEKAARLFTFDAALGAPLAAFGVHGELEDDDAPPSAFELNRPQQLAFTADGSLLVADRDDDLVQGFGLPGAPVVVALRERGGKGKARLEAVASGVVMLTQRVGAREGGAFQHPDGAGVSIPPAALAQDLDVSVAPVPATGSDAAARQAAMTGASLASASSAHQFGPEGLQFAQPATITLPYDPGLLGGVNPSQLKTAYWNQARGAWETLASNVDPTAHTVSAQVLHFSLYQVLAPAQAFTTMADPEATFALRTIYVFPNPAVGGAKPTISVAVGVADRVKIDIYDVAGTPLDSVTLNGPPRTVSDELGTHYAYEYTWDGHIPSGVYIYAVTAEKVGNAPIRRIGKFGVVR